MKSLRFACLFTIFISTFALAQNNPVPLINQPLVPASVKPGSGGFSLTVNGTGFSPGSIVNWNGSPRVTEVISNSQLKATINAADVAKAGTARVKVVNPAPGGGSSNPVYFPIRTSSSAVAFASTFNKTFPSTGVVAVRDFNGDGNLDVAVGFREKPGGSVWVYLGKGDGTFKAPIKTRTTVPVDTILAADLNNDGKADIVVANSRADDNVQVLLGKGDGTFTQKPAFVSKEFNQFLAVADFNGDGKLDLFVGGFGKYGNGFGILLGNGDGTFATPAVYNGFDGGNPAIGDFNGDGILDLAVPNAYFVDVYLGNGDGTFQSPVEYQPADGVEISIAAADVNGDGKLDLITDGVAVLLGNGDGTFTDDGGVRRVGPAYNLQVGDLNGDGKLDVAYALFDSTQVRVLLGNGDGTFQSPLTFMGSGTSNFFSILALGDFNNDGRLDLVDSSSVVTVFLQDQLVLSPPNLDFGNQQVDTTSPPQIVTLTNVGSSAVKIKGISITGSNPGDFKQKNNCGPSVKGGGSCQISVTFTPQAEGARSAALSVSYVGPGSPQTVPLSGTGTPAPTVSLTPSKLAFPVQLVGTTSSAQAATLTNTGSVAVTISNITTSASFSETNNCPSSLPVSGSCKIEVSFQPTAKGPASGKLSVTDDATGSPQTVALSGTGTVVELSPIGVNFGDQKVGTKSTPVPVQLTNVGTTALSISQITITGSDTGDFSQTNNCGSSVPAGGSCTIDVTFQPTAKGSRSAKLSVSDDGGGSPQDVPLTGTGT